jgi:AraC family transcriptional regulator of adaptative response / DNA-3-methyladenine glycosylase II
VLAEADLRGVGLPARRAEAIRGLARAVAAGELDLEGLPDAEAAIEKLRALPGIGPWTASYVAMRIARDPDVLLADDLGVRHALSRGSALPTPTQVVRRAEAWRPWRAYAVMLLWGAGARRTPCPRRPATAAVL